MNSTTTQPTDTTDTTDTTDAQRLRQQRILLAVARATGRAPIPDDEQPLRVRSAFADYNARGKCRAHWFRLAWRNGAWTYIGERLDRVGALASSRHQTVHADVWPGEILVQHDRGGPIDAAFLIVDDAEAPLELLPIAKRRDGQLAITLPEGEVLVRPDPRRA